MRAWSMVGVGKFYSAHLALYIYDGPIYTFVQFHQNGSWITLFAQIIYIIVALVDETYTNK